MPCKCYYAAKKSSLLDSLSTLGNNGHTPLGILRGIAVIIICVIIRQTANTADSVYNFASAIRTVCIIFLGDGSVPTGAAGVIALVRIGAGARVNGSGVAHIISRLNPVQAISRTVEIISFFDIDFALLLAGA